MRAATTLSGQRRGSEMVVNREYHPPRPVATPLFCDGGARWLRNRWCRRQTGYQRFRVSTVNSLETDDGLGFRKRFKDATSPATNTRIRVRAK